MQITLNNLRKLFGDKVAVDIPSFTIDHGTILGLVGNNGAGKTTLFRLLLDLLRADDGGVLFSTVHGGASIDPAQSEDWKSLTGAFIDDSFLIDFLTPEEYLDFIARVNNLPAIEWSNPASSVIAPFIPFTGGEVFGQKKLIRDLSAGNKQKVGIISALFTRPELVILDEPFNFLDPSGQNILKHLLLSYHEESGATILISSHNLQHTVEISSRIALMESGHIIEDLPNTDASAADSLREYFDR